MRNQLACFEVVPERYGPPTHIPFFFEAAILSRIRSPVTSLSNCANERGILRMSLPMGVVVLNCWVTETKETRTAMHGFLTHYIIDDINEFADLYNAEQSTRVAFGTSCIVSRSEPGCDIESARFGQLAQKFQGRSSLDICPSSSPFGLYTGRLSSAGPPSMDRSGVVGFRCVVD